MRRSPFYTAGAGGGRREAARLPRKRFRLFASCGRHVSRRANPVSVGARHATIRSSSGRPLAAGTMRENGAQRKAAPVGAAFEDCLPLSGGV